MEPANEESILGDDLITVKRKLFSKLSLFFGCFTIFLFCLLIYVISNPLNRTKSGMQASRWFAYGIYASCLAGTICAIISMTQREKNSFKKIAGIILNFLSFLLIAGSICFALYLRMKNAGKI